MMTHDGQTIKKVKTNKFFELNMILLATILDDQLEYLNQFIDINYVMSQGAVTCTCSQHGLHLGTY